MTMTRYANGYGLKENPPQCSPSPTTMECTCCHGAQEHPYGAGMDADAVPCIACNGYGYLETCAPKPDSASQTTKAQTAKTKTIKTVPEQPIPAYNQAVPTTA